MTVSPPALPADMPSVATTPPALCQKVDNNSINVSSGVAERRGMKLEIKSLSMLDSPMTTPSAPMSSDTASMHGWQPNEWHRWMSDTGSSLHTGSSRSVLLGMENFGNSCYANSVLQALYYCQPFRNAVMTMDKTAVFPSPYSDAPPPATLKDMLTRLFHSMALNSLRLSDNEGQGRLRHSNTPGTPAILSRNVDAGALKAFLATLHQNCDLFDSTMHHDAHEFLNFILNQVCEDMMSKRGRRTPKLREQAHTPMSVSFNNLPMSRVKRTYIHDLFQGILTNETRCLSCETITNRDEEFLDLSINVEHNTSVSSSLRFFSEREMLSGRNKFFCDTCCSLQEAETRMKIKQPPNILALHLKRIKWDETRNAHVKHACRVVFPLDMRLFNTTEQASQPDQLYELFAVVVHIGLGAHQGHYVSLIKIGLHWAIFDDEDVSFIPESDISKYFGDQPETGSAYVLFYQAVQEEAPPTQAHGQQVQGTTAAASTSLTAMAPTGPSAAAPTPAVSPTEARTPRLMVASPSLQFTPVTTTPVPNDIKNHAPVPTQTSAQQAVPKLVLEPSSVPKDPFMQGPQQSPPDMKHSRPMEQVSTAQRTRPLSLQILPQQAIHSSAQPVKRSDSSASQRQLGLPTLSESAGMPRRDSPDVSISRTDSTSSSRDRRESNRRSWLGRSKLGRILS